jgi:hypothetical protein
MQPVNNLEVNFNQVESVTNNKEQINHFQGGASL